MKGMTSGQPARRMELPSSVEPVAESVTVRFYHDGESEDSYRTEAMVKEGKGVWAYRTKEVLHKVYYDFELSIEGKMICSADPYAKACGINGKRSMM
mgnify:CR=1 FL=1